jgi:RsmE family RNA methyltransferase
MNLVLLDAAEIDAGRRTARLSDRRAEHLRAILRAEPGRVVRVGVTDGRVGTATVLQSGTSSVLLGLSLKSCAPEPPGVHLVLAVPRPKVLSRVLQAAAAMAVRRIDLVNAWRVEKAYFESPRLSPRSLRANVWLGAEQGRIPWLPTVEVHRYFVPFVEHQLPRLLAGAPTVRLVAHPESVDTIEQIALDSRPAPVVVAVGPEGGFIKAELESFVRAGFVSVSVSQRVLRVETAVAAVLSQLELIRRLWSAH